MRAAVSTSTAPWLTIEARPDPTPGPGDLILRVDACGICGSDLHMAQAMADRPGTIFGHEFCGTVVAMGSEVTGHQPGERIVGFPLVGCRSCPACQSGSPSKCRRVRLIGAQRPGAYAEYVAVDAAASLALPAKLSTELGALVEPLAVAHHALDRTPREAEEPVLILGAGPVGLAAALWAQVLGAREVVVSDPAAGRRALAARLGATVVDPDQHDVGRAFADVAGSRPRAIIECVGRPGVIQQAVDAAAPDAHVTLVGACTAPDTFEPVIATAKELTLRFVVYYQRSDFVATISAMTAGRLDATGLVTGRVGLDELPSRFTALMSPGADCKVLITP